MIPSLFLQLVLKRLWQRALWRHIAIVLLCLWALSVQMTYRIPGGIFFFVLPWTAVALSALSILLFASYLLTRSLEENPLRESFARIEWWCNMVIRLFVYSSLVLYVNGRLDTSEPRHHRSQIMSISGDVVHLGYSIPYSWATLKSWDNPTDKLRVFLQPEENESLWGGQQVVVRTRQGVLGISWVERIERNDEHYAKEVLKLVPAATGAWKTLVGFLLKQKRWDEASTATREILKLAPKSYDFALNVGSYLVSNHAYAKGIEFLEYSTAHRPTYDGLRGLGWALSYQGNKARAAEVLERCLRLNPDRWEAYYHLGYVYGELGKLDEAVASFKKTLELHPDFLEVEGEIAQLQRLIAVRKPARQ